MYGSPLDLWKIIKQSSLNAFESRTAFGKHLEEKHVTWARFGKKLDKNTTFQACDFHPNAFTKSAKKVKFLINSVTFHVVETASEIHLDAIRIKER
ncbi:hypothetical protein Tco_0423967 [Tanacetum coccineum]